MTGHRYAVTFVEPLRHEELYFSVRRAARGDDTTSPAAFQWQYRDAPDGEPHALLLHAVVADRPEPVGWISVEPRSLVIRGKAHDAGLLVNLAVDPRHRTATPALILQRGAMARARAHHALSYGYCHPSALGGFLAAGYHYLGPVTRYACVLRGHAGKLAHSGVSRELAAMAGLAADTAGPVARRALWWRWQRDYALEWPATLDERFDRFWQRAVANDRGSIIGARHRAFLAWRWNHPHEPYALAALTEAHTEEIAAYAAIRREGRRAHLGDLFAVRDDAYGPLCDGLLAALGGDGVDCVDFCHLGRPAVVAALRWRGFRPREATRVVVVDPGTLESAWSLDPRRWHLTTLDGDL